MERRREVRVPVAFFVNRYIDGVPYLCHVSNISQTGLLLHRMGGPHYDESDVVLEVELPGHEDVLCLMGSVVHQTDETMGISLEHDSSETLRSYKSYVNQRIAELPLT